MQKIIAAAATALALTTAAASAADLPSRGPAPVFAAAAAPYNWSGFYVGVNAGGAWGNRNCGDYLLNVAPPFTASTCGGSSGSNNGRFTYGAQLGYNWQYNSLVLGIEADINGLTGRNRSNGSFVFAGPPLGAAGRYTFNNGNSSNYFGTVRGRVGYAIDRLLLYVTGGLAFGGSGGNSVSASFFPGPPFAATPDARFTTGGGSRNNRVGYAFGGGLEYAFTNNWSVKGEYLYVHTGRGGRGGAVTCTAIVAGACAAFPAGTTFNRVGRSNNALNIVRIGLNYKF